MIFRALPGACFSVSFAGVWLLGSVAQFVGDFNRILGLVKVFDEFCGKSLVFDRRGARAKARRLAPLLV